MLLEKIVKLSLVSCCLATFSQSASSAIPDTSGSIKFTGTLFANGCTVATPNVTVRVPISLVGDYSSAGTAGPTSTASDGSVSLTNCPQGITVAFTVTGTPDSTNPALFQVKTGVGQATGVGLKLQMDSETGSISPNGSTSYYPTTDLGGSLGYGLKKNFRVTPVSTAATVTAGKLDTSLTFTLAYK